MILVHQHKANMSSMEANLANLRNTIESVANASVMGPEYASELLQRLQSNPEVLQQIASVAVQRRSSRGGRPSIRA